MIVTELQQVDDVASTKLLRGRNPHWHNWQHKLLSKYPSIVYFNHGLHFTLQASSRVENQSQIIQIDSLKNNHSALDYDALFHFYLC